MNLLKCHTKDLVQKILNSYKSTGNWHVIHFLKFITVIICGAYSTHFN